MLSVTVTFSPRADEIDEVALSLPHGATVADALGASEMEARHPGLAWAELPVGVWSRPCARTSALRDGDRVEVYRPLVVDPKEARRLRQRSQLAAGKRSGG
ncbi:MAG TPA: RnfH family protein [Burkholderiaceae bacterium]|nr:RnfH family protein [Burkholderiaceae bacterium]